MSCHRTYNVILSSDLDDTLTNISSKLQISKAEVMRRSLVLFIHAAKSDGIKLITGETEVSVLIK